MKDAAVLSERFARVVAELNAILGYALYAAEPKRR